MTAVKPPITPPVAPAAARPAPPHGQAAGPPQSAFQPGLEARRADASRPIKPPQAQEPQQPRASTPAGEGRQLFTIQALSAYAGAIINEMGSDAGPASTQGQSSARLTGPGRRNDSSGAPAPRPGGRLDLKV